MTVFIIGISSLCDPWLYVVRGQESELCRSGWGSPSPLVITIGPSSDLWVFSFLGPSSGLTSCFNHCSGVVPSVTVISHKSIQKFGQPCMYLSKPPALTQLKKGSLINASNSVRLYGSKVLAFMGMPLLSSSMTLYIHHTSVAMMCLQLFPGQVCQLIVLWWNVL
jgi:hypothetical protein